MFTTQFKPHRTASLVAGLSAALLGIFLASSASASLVINLRFDDSGTGGTTTKDISGLAATQTVVIQVWATVTGANTTTTDDGLNSSFFGLASANAATANLTGDITTGTAFSPFSIAAADGGQLGTFGDRNADGIGDWRGTALTSATGWAKVGHGTSQVLSGGSDGHANLADPTHAWDFHIADAVFTINSITVPGSGTINALTYNAAVIGNLGLTNSGKASWFEDGASKTGTTTLPSAGTGVTFTLGGGVVANPDIDPTPTSLQFNVLLNSVGPQTPKNVTLTNNGAASGTYSTSTPPPNNVASVTSGGSGTIGVGLTAPMGVTVTGLTTAYGNQTGSVVVSTTGDPDLPAQDTVNVIQNVGQATTTGTTFSGAMVLTANVAATSGTYTGLASRTTAGGVGLNVGTEAKLLAGTNATGGAEVVSMQWRQRTISERGPADNGIPASPPLPISARGDIAILISDVVSLTGLAAADTSQNTAGHTKTDQYVLQMSYDPGRLIGGGEATKATEGSIFLAWLNPNGGGAGIPQWENAVVGNFVRDPNALFDFQGTYAQAGSPTTLGSWGVDISSHVVWAVLDHASEFAVVPEPGTMALFGVGAIGLLVGMRRRRR